MFFLILFLILLALVLPAAWFAYYLPFHVPKNHREDPFDLPKGPQYEAVHDTMLRAVQRVTALPYEQVFITSFDGTRLAARYYHKADGAPVQIQFHGYRSCAQRDFSGGTLLALEMGQNVLVADQRAHGLSGGHVITFGVKERRDCLCWVDYVNQRFGADTKIVLAGISMGAATVLMASQLKLPDNVAGIIADSPYSAPGAIIQKVCRDVKFPVKLVYPFVTLGALVFGRFRLWEATASEAVKTTHIPILLIHGEDDHFVPCEMSREIFDACAAPKMLHTFPGAGHGLGFTVDSSRYKSIIKDFMKMCGIQ